MKTQVPVLIMLITFAGITSCDEEEDPTPQMELAFDFEGGSEGWEAGFTDYYPNSGTDYELNAGMSQLPAPLDDTQPAFRISGSNRSDDLFMFLKRKIEGLQPKTTYELVFDVSMASAYPEGSVGIGGSPGASVYLKSGATTEEPIPVLDSQIPDFLILNIDKGNQSNPGADMQVIGNIGIDKEEFEYTLISRSNSTNPFEITTDEEGSMWVILGTDSGFEGKTTLYYNQIRLNLTAKG
ncbi:MAG: hypothetical protein AAF824_10675 [Bacteroidota bacterium]